MAHSYSYLYNLPTTGLRFFTVYGPWGRPDMALFLFTKAIVENKPINVFNYGNMERDFTYIDDIVDGIEKIIPKVAVKDKEWSGINPNPSTSKAPYKVYNIGNNSPVKLMDFIKAIENKLNKKAQINLKHLQPGDVPSTFADVEELIKDFDYKPKTSIEEGIDKFIEWYKNYYIRQEI